MSHASRRRLLILCGYGSAASSASPPETWPAFRGSGDSITQAKQLPLKWSATENIAWTATLPGYGQSSPVVWKDKVFVTAIEGESKETEFVAHLARTVETDPTGEWIFVVDRLNTHMSESLVKFVAERCGLPDALGKKAKVAS